MIVHGPEHPDYNPTFTLPEGVPGYVYLIAPIGVKVYKIGCSINPERRLKTLQGKLDCKLEIVATLFYSDYERAERYWQNKYKRYCLSVEWFALPDDAVEYFKGLQK